MSRDRDRILEDALKHELRGAASPTEANPAHRSLGEGGCLDAETLAAWSDGGLDATQAAMAEAHVSSCARCQSLVSTFVSGTLTAGTDAPDPAPGTEALGTWAWWKWLTPLAAGAAAVTLWMVVPQQREIAEAPPQAPAASKAAESLPDTPAPPGAVPPDAAALRDNSPLDSSRNQIKAETSEAKQQAAPPAREREARKESASADTTVALQQASPIVPPSAPAPAAPAAPAVAAGSAAVAGLQRRAEFAFVPLEIISPAASQRWRVTTTGIELSTDGGANWSLVRAAAGETITAGTSPSASVCWLIGNNGVVLLTANGSAFTRVDIPDAGNLRSITATSGSSATVINAAGRTFRTDDSGRTWR